MRYELGTANASRRGTNPNLGAPGTAEWLVARIIDSNNNYAVYEYGNGTTRAARIARIRYNGNAGTGVPASWTVTFNWTNNFDAKANSFRSGYERLFGADLLNDIVVTIPPHATTGNPAAVPASSPQSRTYHFTYSDLHAETDAIHYLLSAQAGNFPPVVFEYSNPLGTKYNDAERLIDTTGQNYPGHLGFVARTGDGDSITRSVLVDATRDARLDLVDAISEGSDKWSVWVSRDSFFEHQLWMAPLDLTDTAMPDDHALRIVTGTDTVQDFFDLDGDGYPDLLWIVNTVSGPLIKYCPGNGHGFDACGPYGGGAPNNFVLRKDTTPTGDTTMTVVDFADMNGDGLVDILSVSGSQLAVYRNLGKGSGFSQSPLVSTMPACPWPFVTACLRLNQTIVVPGGNRRQLADIRDVNGDGLVDYVVNDFYTNELRIAYGDGRAFRPFVATGRYFSIGIGNQAGDGSYTAVDDMIDMNGDGMLDIFHMDCGTTTYSITFNDGGVWDPTPHVYQATDATAGHFSACSNTQQPWTISSGESGVATTTHLADYDGDGAADFVSAPLDPNFPSSVRVGQMEYRAPRLILRAKSLTGHHTLAVEWRAANNAGESDWEPGSLITGGPSPVHVPHYVTRSITPLYPEQPVRATWTTTVYKFDGSAFDAQEREFAGFFMVTAAGPSWGTTTITNYGTSLVQRGLVLSKRRSNNSGVGIGENLVNQYSYVALPGGRTFAQLDSTEIGPPPMPGFPQPAALTVYEAYNAFGQPTRWIEYGRQLVDGDEYFNERSYLSRNDDSFMLSVVAEETRQPGTTTGGTALRTRRYYDDHNVFALAPTAGNLVKVERDTGGGKWIATEAFFDANGNIYRRLDEMGVSTTYAYDQTYARFPVRETNPVGTTYRSFHALTASEADACGPQYSGASYRCSRSEVDAFGRITATWVPTLVGSTYGVAQLTSLTYQDNAYPPSVTVTKRGLARTIQYRDGFGNAVQLRVEDTANHYRVYDSTFDADGRAIRVEQPYFANGATYAWAPQSSEAWVYEYDAVHDSVEQATYPRSPGDIGPPAVATQGVQVDRTVVVDEDGRETDYVQDAYRRVTRVERYDGTAHHDTSFTYDIHNQINSVTDPVGNVTSYQRDLVGRLSIVTPPGLGAFTYKYNQRGQVTSTLDQRGVSVTYGYDIPGRLTTISSTGGGTQVRQIAATLAYYDAATDARQLGWLRSESSDSITQTYAYDAEQSVRSHQVTALGWSGTVSFAYDIGKRLKSVTYPDSNRADYEYDLSDTVSSIVAGATTPFNGFVFASLDYDNGGRLSQVWSEGGLIEAYTYDARGRRTAVLSINEAGSLPGPLVDDEITLSKAGDVTSLVRTGLKPGGIVRTTPDIFTITNDAFHQVTRVDLNGALMSKYAYDAAGQMTTFNETGTTDSSVSTYTNDRLVQRATGDLQQNWAYDAAGQVTSDDEYLGGTHEVRGHRWDALQRYTRTTVFDGTSTEYFYTPSGQLSRVTAPSELSTAADNLYIGSWARLDMSTGTWTDQISANGRLLLETTGTGVEMPHRTIQDTVAAVTDSAATVIRQEEFSPFGTRIAGNADGRFELHYQGLRVDELVVAGGRAYDPRAGRWLARDPLHHDPAKFLDDVRLVNTYALDFSNPYAFRDPSGMWPSWGDVTDFVADEWNEVKKGASQAWGDITYAAESVGEFVSDNKRTVAAVGIVALVALTDGLAAPLLTAEGAASTSLLGTSLLEAGVGTALARQLGTAGETAAGIVKNTERIPSLTGTAQYRIPDALDHSAKVIGEVKNVASLSYTRQLKDFVAYSQQSGYAFNLWVRSSTRLSGPLRQAVNDVPIILRPLP